MTKHYMEYLYDLQETPFDLSDETAQEYWDVLKDSNFCSDEFKSYLINKGHCNQYIINVFQYLEDKNILF